MSSAKPNSGTEVAARLLDLVPFLISHQGISVQDLAKQFGVTAEEITSDLTTLWMCGLPGYTAYELIDLSFESGFVTISNAQTLQRPRNLDRNEALALLLGLETLLEEIELTHPELAISITTLISKIARIMDHTATLRVKAGTAGSSILRAKISEAIDSRGLLNITYHSSSHDQVAERIVKPLEFSSRNGTEYLEAFCMSTNGYRTFRLDRIISAEKEESSSSPIPAEGSSQESAPSTFTMTIFTRARDVFERFSIAHPLSSLEGEVRAQSFSSEWTLRQVMSLGGGAAISSPESLRSALREKALRALRAYSQDAI